MAERLAKFMARSGVCSRRMAETLINQKRVTVNGEVVETPAFNVEGNEKILLDGEPLPTARSTVFENLPPDMPRVISVGRLDLNSEGLLLLTNNGELSRQLELPKNAWSRRYKVRVHGTLNMKKLAELEKGVIIDGVQYGPVKIEKESQNGTNSWLLITLCEGKNREVRKLMKSVGLEVARLIRLSYGPFQLGNLKKGEVKEVPFKVLKEQLGSQFQL